MTKIVVVSLCSVFNLNNKIFFVNALISCELLGFIHACSLTMNSKFLIPRQNLVQYSNFLFIVGKLVQVYPDNGHIKTILRRWCSYISDVRWKGNK